MFEDFDPKEEDAPSYEKCPEGTHPAYISNAEVGYASTGTGYLEVSLECLVKSNGKPPGLASVRHRYYRSQDPSKVAYFHTLIRSICRAVNYFPEKGGFEPRMIIGHVLVVNIWHEPDRSDPEKTYAKINTGEGSPFHGVRAIEDKDEALDIGNQITSMMTGNSPTPTDTSSESTVPF